VVWLAVLTASLANIVNIAADLSSMAAVIRMFLPIPQLVLVAMLGIGSAAAEILIPYQKYARVLKWLCLSLLSYLVVLTLVRIDHQELLAGIRGQDFHWNQSTYATLIALAGTTISPYLFFWQTAEEVEENAGHPTCAPSYMRAMRLDVFAGMFSGLLVMFAIMATSAATMHQAGIVEISTPEQAASVLEPLAGQFATTLFALGILGTGLLAVPVLAGSTAYAISELFGWRDSLAEKPSAAKPFYTTIALAIMLAVLLNVVGVNPMHSLVLAAQLNGLAAPLLLFLIWRTGRNQSLMQEWRSPWWSSAILGLLFAALTALPILWLFS
jgi:Mn2+/Fe2+ NRAMP family transporter